MAVELEIDPSAEVNTTENQSAIDLANPGPVEKSIEKETPTRATNADEVKSGPLPDPESQIDAAFEIASSKWIQDFQEATKMHGIYIESTKDLMIGLDKEISKTSEELKSLKDQKKGAVERLIQLETRGPEFPPKPTRDAVARLVQATQQQQQQGSSAKDSTSAEVQSSNASTSQPVNESTEWRTIPAIKIIDGIERLGEKKRDAIVDAFPTLGDLEDIRGEASKEHVHFAEKLPDGIGKTIADKIEERMMDEIAKYSLSAKTQGVIEEKLNQSSVEGEVEYEDVEDDEDGDEDDTDIYTEPSDEKEPVTLDDL